MEALRSRHLAFAIDAYLQAFRESLDAHYPAVNTLGLLKAQAQLARDHPEVWQEKFDDERAADDALRSLDQAILRITATLQLALGLDDVVGRPASLDAWAVSSKAGLLLLTLSNKPQRVAEAYRQALAGADHFAIEATRRNVEMFKGLGLFEPNASAALDAIDEALTATRSPPPRRVRVVLFTGHMIDTLWMMFNAIATDARNLTLVALYNADRDPDGPGGTGHLVETARRWGFKTVSLDARALLEE